MPGRDKLCSNTGYVRFFTHDMLMRSKGLLVKAEQQFVLNSVADSHTTFACQCCTAGVLWHQIFARAMSAVAVPALESLSLLAGWQ